MSHHWVERRPRRRMLAAIGLGAAIACTATAPVQAQALEVVADGLGNPRGMTFGPNGRLYVAEAGRGGTGACIPSPEGGDQCYGATGAITRINVRNGVARRIVQGLPSLAPQAEITAEGGGENATGPHDVSFDDDDRMYFVTGLGANPAVRALLGAGGRRFAGLYRATRAGRRVRLVADLGAYEAANNPDAGSPGAEVDSNPFSLDATVGERILVTDAGGNDVLTVREDGSVTTRSVFAFRPTNAPPGAPFPPFYQPVPTGIVRVPGGAYVGQLTGFPFLQGEAKVFRLANGPTEVAFSGFTTIVDLAVDDDENLYVLQITTNGLAGPPSPGRLFKVAPDGSREELAAGLLVQPSGVAVAEDGDVYVSNKSGSGTDAEIVRIPAED